MTELQNSIVELRNLGYTYSQIAKELNCSKGTISYYLAEDGREKNVARRANGRTKVLNFLHEYKQKSGCMDCKEDYPYWMLDFDHVYGTKDFNLSASNALGKRLDQVQEEVAKCEVVCANCHRNRTHMRTSGAYSMDISATYGVAASAVE